MFAALSIRIRAGMEMVRVRSIVVAIVTEQKYRPRERAANKGGEYGEIVMKSPYLG